MATAEAGVNWGEFDAATQEHGLAVTGGRNPTTGIAGLTLGSGSGWLERKLGYTVDNLLGCEIVTADGDVLHAGEGENSELFWGLRGGGGNFGIVTKFEYRLHPIGPIIYGGQYAFPAYPPSSRPTATSWSPLRTTSVAPLLCSPLPTRSSSRPPCAACPSWASSFATPASRRTAPPPTSPSSTSTRHSTWPSPCPTPPSRGCSSRANPSGMRNYWKADMYPEMPDEALDALMNAAAAPPSPLNTIIVQPLGGAVHRVADDATAMGWRKAKWALHILGMWEDRADDEKNIEWVRNIDRVMKPWAQEAGYLNYLMDEGDQRIKDSFGANYERMVALKNKYDPTNFFHLNQNIKPTTNGHR